MKNDNKYFPKECHHCGSTQIESVTKEILNGIVCEYEVVCKECKKRIGYWAYGYWQI